MKELKVGLLGFGTVGAGVVKCLAQNGELIGARTGVKPVIAKIADLDITTDRGVKVDPALLTTDAGSVIDDPNIEVIIELVGGTTIAKDFILRALNQGKPVVTANKALLAYHGDEIFTAAKDKGADIYYEASVAGGIPIIKSLREGLAANHIQSIFGILNGTCNYILTRMEEEQTHFQPVLDAAQKLGYAEADPSLDVDGGDAAHKTVIMASLAYGTWFKMDELHVEGIRNLELVDIANAADLGYRIKLLGIVKLRGEQIEMRVHPTLIPQDALLSKVDDVFNAVFVEGDVVGETMFYGRGAGQDATASAVVADLVDVGLNLKHGSSNRVSAFRPHASYGHAVPLDDVITRYYLRLQVKDIPGCFAQISRLIADEKISISSVVQKEVNAPTVPLVIITHEAREADMKRALEKIAALDIVEAAPVMLRIEDI